MANQVANGSEVKLRDTDGGVPDIVEVTYRKEDSANIGLTKKMPTFREAADDAPTNDPTYGDIKQKLRDVHAYYKSIVPLT